MTRGGFQLANPGQGSPIDDETATGQLEYNDRAVVDSATTTTIKVICDSGTTHYAVTEEKPTQLNDSAWVACPALGADIVSTPSLSSGENSVKAWFRNSVGINPTPQTIIIHKEPFRFYHLPLAELADSNLASQLPVALTDHLSLVADPLNDTAGANSGAVHIINRRGDIIHSIRGRCPGDEFGSLGVMAMGSERFVVVSPKSKSADCSVAEVGSVTVHNLTGDELARFEGSITNDRVGSCGLAFPNGVKVLANGNLYICSSEEDAGGLVDSGRVRLISGSDYSILLDLPGDVAGDKMGLSGDGIRSGVLELGNGNIAINSSNDSILAGLSQVGSFHLINSSTGAVLFSKTGSTAGDQLGGNRGIRQLSGGAILIDSLVFQSGGIQAGKLETLDPTNGAAIDELVGSNSNLTGWLFGEAPITLSNGNLVYRATLTASGDAGLLALVNASNGSIIPISGTPGMGAQLGGIGSSIASLTNSNFVVTSTVEQNGAVPLAGSVNLINGSTGAVINSRLGTASLHFSNSIITALRNGNFILNRPNFSGNLGRLELVSGTDGSVLQTINGAANNDTQSAYVIEGGDDLIAIGLPNRDNPGLVNSGCFYIMSSTTGTIESTYCGAVANDMVGGWLANLPRMTHPGSPVVVISSDETVMGTRRGTIRIFHPTTGVLMNTLEGETPLDLISARAVSISSSISLIGLRAYSAGGLTYSGRVLIFQNSDGSVLNTIDGTRTFENLGDEVFNYKEFGTNQIVISSSKHSSNGLNENGRLYFIDKTSGAIVRSIDGSFDLARLNTLNLTQLGNGDVIFRLLAAAVEGLNSAGAYLLVPGI